MQAEEQMAEANAKMIVYLLIMLWSRVIFYEYRAEKDAHNIK